MEAALFASKAKFDGFFQISNGAAPKESVGLISAFDVIVQPLVNTLFIALFFHF